MTKIVEFIAEKDNQIDRDRIALILERCARKIRKEGQAIIYVDEEHIHDELGFKDK